MLGVAPLSVFGKSKQYLESRQNDIDAEVIYADKVTKAATAWKSKSAVEFAALRGALESLCTGSRRCHYCEDSVADEVEHIWPKKFYPEKTFRWINFLFACGQCNGVHKRDLFAIFLPAGQVLNLVRTRGSLVSAPPVGDPVFIDPRVDDPLSLIALDLETGIFVPSDSPDTISFVRADYTIDILGLNKRDYLVRARKNAYGSYLDAARQYVARMQEGAPIGELKQRVQEISERHHRSVWAEMKRMSTIPAHSFFLTAPELLDC